jgi:hypothetical protein
MANVTRPPLEDPLHERELFASEVVGVGAVHGNISVTLASVRFDERIGTNPPMPHRVVTARLVLTGIAAGQLLQHLQQLAAQIEASVAAAVGKQPH